MTGDNSAFINTAIHVFNYMGDAIFAISGALAAGRERLDIVGYVFIGVITGIGGGTIRDLLLGRTVWWVKDPSEMLVCVFAALLTFFWPGQARKGGAVALVWSDAIGVSAFCVVGSSIALQTGAHPVIAVLMGMITCIGGGVIRDVLTTRRPMILRGELYAVAVLAGAATYVLLVSTGVPGPMPSICGFFITLVIRSLAIIYSIRLGPPGEFLRIGDN
ncbi:trimeric intracellular cation channel family protein [Maridesulfovibrio sp.]|uniref:trimeric intracellular cation channel family protein n=1 Tax=Maridesulfovibrio sp. TaxID=2795000 RepID=UPI002A1893EA|nr:trimeric intracellular cation channel family protein [Maridesulfovibrio sp.]